MNRKAVTMMNFPQASSPESVILSMELEKRRNSGLRPQVSTADVRIILGDIHKGVAVGPGIKNPNDLLVELTK